MQAVEWEAHRVQSNLVHDNNSSLLNVLFQLLHRRRHVRRRDHVRLGPDRRLDHLRVESVRNQRDGHVGLLQSLVESSIIANVEGDGLGVLESLAQLLGILEGSACCYRLVSFPPLTLSPSAYPTVYRVVDRHTHQQ